VLVNLLQGLQTGQRTDQSGKLHLEEGELKALLSLYRPLPAGIIEALPVPEMSSQTALILANVKALSSVKESLTPEQVTMLDRMTDSLLDGHVRNSTKSVCSSRPSSVFGSTLNLMASLTRGDWSETELDLLLQLLEFPETADSEEAEDVTLTTLYLQQKHLAAEVNPHLRLLLSDYAIWSILQGAKKSRHIAALHCKYMLSKLLQVQLEYGARHLHEPIDLDELQHLKRIHFMLKLCIMSRAKFPLPDDFLDSLGNVSLATHDCATEQMELQLDTRLWLLLLDTLRTGHGDLVTLTQVLQLMQQADPDIATPLQELANRLLVLPQPEEEEARHNLDLVYCTNGLQPVVDKWFALALAGTLIKSSSGDRSDVANCLLFEVSVNPSENIKLGDRELANMCQALAPTTTHCLDTSHFYGPNSSSEEAVPLHSLLQELASSCAFLEHVDAAIPIPDDAQIRYALALALKRHFTQLSHQLALSVFAPDASRPSFDFLLTGPKLESVRCQMRRALKTAVEQMLGQVSADPGPVLELVNLATACGYFHADHVEFLVNSRSLLELATSRRVSIGRQYLEALQRVIETSAEERGYVSQKLLTELRKMLVERARGLKPLMRPQELITLHKALQISQFKGWDVALLHSCLVESIFLGSTAPRSVEKRLAGESFLMDTLDFLTSRREDVPKWSLETGGGGEDGEEPQLTGQRRDCLYRLTELLRRERRLTQSEEESVRVGAKVALAGAGPNWPGSVKQFLHNLAQAERPHLHSALQQQECTRALALIDSLLLGSNVKKLRISEPEAAELHSVQVQTPRNFRTHTTTTPRQQPSTCRYQFRRIELGMKN
ncbi:hypothetical protein Ciccas_012914, partial [Cichlidogyrus casuarinus]